MNPRNGMVAEAPLLTTQTPPADVFAPDPAAAWPVTVSDMAIVATLNLPDRAGNIVATRPLKRPILRLQDREEYLLACRELCETRDAIAAEWRQVLANADREAAALVAAGADDAGADG